VRQRQKIPPDSLESGGRFLLFGDFQNGWGQKEHQNHRNDQLAGHVAAVIEEGIEPHGGSLRGVHVPDQDAAGKVAQETENYHRRPGQGSRQGGLELAKGFPEQVRKAQSAKCHHVVQHDYQEEGPNGVGGGRVEAQHHLDQAVGNRADQTPFGAKEQGKEDDGNHAPQGDGPAVAPGRQRELQEGEDGGKGHQDGAGAKRLQVGFHERKTPFKMSLPAMSRK